MEFEKNTFRLWRDPPCGSLPLFRLPELKAPTAAWHYRLVGGKPMPRTARLQPPFFIRLLVAEAFASRLMLAPRTWPPKWRTGTDSLALANFFSLHGGVDYRKSYQTTSKNRDFQGEWLETTFADLHYAIFFTAGFGKGGAFFNR